MAKYSICEKGLVEKCGKGGCSPRKADREFGLERIMK
jgi:hypothetical protein